MTLQPEALHARLYRRLRAQILAGSLAPGARLPSSRALASDLGLSRNTVEAALAQLVDEGFVERRVGAGTTVTRCLAEVAPFLRSCAPSTTPPTPAPPRLGRRGELLLELGRTELAADARVGPWTADTAGFPWAIWNRLLGQAARRLARFPEARAHPLGLEALRRQIVEHVSLARGLRCEAGQVILVHGTQQAIDLAARVLLDPGDTALVEDPGYPSARAALTAAGARVEPVPVDEEGVVAEALLEHPAARLLYLTPSHQFPLGSVLSLGRRLAVLGWAAERGAWVLEDDYDSEFRHDGRPIAALQALDSAGRVLYLGTFNKVLFPGLRLGYLIVPEPLVEAFAAARRITDGPPSPLHQAVLAEFLARGHFATYLRHARAHYADCRDLLTRAIAERWPPLALGPVSTGLHLIVQLPPGTDDHALAAAAPRDRLAVAPLSRYYLAARPDEAQARGLLIGYGAATREAILAFVAAMAPLLAALPSLGSPKPAC